MVTNLKNIYNIRSSCSFWDTLAQIYLDKYKTDALNLASVLFLVPNRRACQALTNAFIRIQGMQPTILPKIVPLAEIDDDEIFFQNSVILPSYDNQKHPISKEERLFLFSRLIMSKPTDFGLNQISLAQAISLALDLGNLIDTAYNQGLSFDKLDTLVPEKYATHWQETLRLLKIITEYWPKILEERDAADVCDIKNQLLFKQAELWRLNKTTQPIIAAGITANFPAVTAILKSIMELPNGTIYFAGIDRFADDAYWDAIDESHPQFELKELLEALQLHRSMISDICTASNSEREKFISEFMRPAVVSDQWRETAPKLDCNAALQGLEVMECTSQRSEATAIALKLREILTFPEKTAALVTYDRNLARRVAAELERFDVKVDDSAGLPLSLSSIGIFLRLTAEFAESPDSQIKFISLIKHPLTLCGQSSSTFRNAVYNYELALRKNNISVPDNTEEDIIGIVKQIANEFIEALSSPSISFKTLLTYHIKTAELLAETDDTQKKVTLWQGDAGKIAARFFTKLLESADTLGNIAGKDYVALITELMGLETVRTSYGTHPRLSILGPIEARLCHYDYIIVGEFNEGIWPKAVNADMWMSRPMKLDFGFSLPEKNIGILAADLCGFLSAEHVIITRSERVDGVPMNKSRWLLRMETVLKAAGANIDDINNHGFYLFAEQLDNSKTFHPIKAPAPCPPLWARPRKLSASGLDLLVQDPYSVYAKYILHLYPLNDLDIPPDQRDYGSLIHAIIEEFNNLYPTNLPQNPLQILLELGKKHFEKANLGKEIITFWLPRFEQTAEWLIKQEESYRFDVAKVYNEISGNICYDLPQGKFVFTAKADRIDILKNGNLNILDYKTGKIPTKKQILSGHALQVLLEGLIAKKGTFSGISSKKVENLIYWKLGSDKVEIDATQDNILQQCEEYLLKLVSIFDMETTPYYSRPIPKFIPKNRDYEHLARIKEWSTMDEATGND